MARLPSIRLSASAVDAPSVVPMFSGVRRIEDTLQHVVGSSVGDVPLAAVEYTLQVVAAVSRAGATCRVSVYSEDGSEVGHVLVSSTSSQTLSVVLPAPSSAVSFELRARMVAMESGDYCAITGAAIFLRWS